MTPTRVILVSAALLSSAAAAQAQTVISRQISEEPVETIVTQGPYGTVVTRRVLDPRYDRRPVAPAYGTVTVRPSVPRTVVVEEPIDDEDVIETVTVRKRPAYVEEPPIRRHRAVRAARRGKPPIMARAVEPEPRRTAVRHVRSAPLALRPAEREVVYRTIVTERVYVPSAPVVAYGGAPYYGGYPRPVAYAIGAPVPQSVALATIPSGLALQVPVTRGYQYTVIDDRVLLVDPATGIIVAEVTRY
ncbi:MAG: DUF1236 domain-containing protein [Xanthobacteraceae bacterium]